MTDRPSKREETPDDAAEQFTTEVASVGEISVGEAFAPGIGRTER